MLYVGTLASSGPIQNVHGMGNGFTGARDYLKGSSGIDQGARIPMGPIQGTEKINLFLLSFMRTLVINLKLIKIQKSSWVCTDKTSGSGTDSDAIRLDLDSATSSGKRVYQQIEPNDDFEGAAGTSE
jgi:hypothetical protein